MSENIINFSQAEASVREEIKNIIKGILGEKAAEIIEIDYPPAGELGDFTVSCFSLGKLFKKPPAAVASQLARNFRPTDLIKNIKAAGPYLNFFVDKALFSKLVLTEIAKVKDKYGSAKIGRGKRVMVEYFSPNTNKQLTIGHLRNICLGWSISRLLEFLGYKVIQTTLYNDRGIAIAKTILGYQKWGEGQTAKSAGVKTDHFVGSFYIRFCQEAKNNPNFENEAQRVLQDWEKGRKEIKEIWQKLTEWVLTGFEQTLSKFSAAKFDERYYESEYYLRGKEIVEKGIKKGVFIKDQQGVVLAPLQKYGLPDKILLRPDETSLYITQDLYLAYLKNKHRPDLSIYVVGNEQDLYFKQLFKILELLGLENNYYHLSYGMIRLPSGKIKSREGVVEGTAADDLITTLEKMAAEEVKKRFSDLNQKELNKRAEQIALGALKFYILAVSPQSTIIFDPKKSLAFTGRTGPYLQYVHARICSILAKERIKLSFKADFSLLSQKSEFELIKLLAYFPAAVCQSAKSYDPSQLANYLYDLAKSFSVFYEEVPVLAAELKVKKARLLLINNVKNVLAKGLGLLGIAAPEKM